MTKSSPAEGSLPEVASTHEQLETLGRLQGLAVKRATADELVSTEQAEQQGLLERLQKTSAKVLEPLLQLQASAEATMTRAWDAERDRLFTQFKDGQIGVRDMVFGCAFLDPMSAEADDYVDYAEAVLTGFDRLQIGETVLVQANNVVDDITPSGVLCAGTLAQAPALELTPDTEEGITIILTTEDEKTGLTTLHRVTPEDLLTVAVGTTEIKAALIPKIDRAHLDLRKGYPEQAVALLLQTTELLHRRPYKALRDLKHALVHDMTTNGIHDYKSHQALSLLKQTDERAFKAAVRKLVTSQHNHPFNISRMIKELLSDERCTELGRALNLKEQLEVRRKADAIIIEALS